MDARTMLTAQALLATARHLTPLQRQTVQTLYDKGPCLLLELAVRDLKFPEEVSQPVQELRDRGLIQAEVLPLWAIGRPRADNFAHLCAVRSTEKEGRRWTTKEKTVAGCSALAS